MRTASTRAAAATLSALVVIAGCTGGHGERPGTIAASAAPLASPSAAVLPATAPSASPSSDAIVVRGPTRRSIGSARASVVMVEFTDYECPFCRRYHRDTFPLLKQRYVDTGKVRYVVRDLPLDIHPGAVVAAEVARCAEAQGRFWPMRDALLDNREELSAARVAALAAEVGIAAPPLQACLDSHRFEADVKADLADARAAGLDRTPSFVIGRERAGAVSGVRMVGAQPAATFAARLDELLRAR